MALARALAIELRVLLLDEPFGALDAKVRKEPRQSLRDIHHTPGLTSIFVTYDQEEAMELADLWPSCRWAGSTYRQTAGHSGPSRQPLRARLQQRLSGNGRFWGSPPVPGGGLAYVKRQR